MTVAKSSIRKAISAVLKEFDIDDLAIEGSIATAVYGFFQRLESGETESIVEGDMLADFERQHADIKYRTELIARVEKALKLNVNASHSHWESALKFIERMERDNGQTIEKYQAWREEDVYNSPKAHHIANKPALVQATWPQAFPEGKQLKLVQSEDGGFDF
ncbi:MAG TPA: hypothetical protein VMV80_08360 [Anaerolineales bacterium]|nr:hypothetical protein [Anaerolineales bacterium]